MKNKKQKKVNSEQETLKQMTSLKNKNPKTDKNEKEQSGNDDSGKGHLEKDNPEQEKSEKGQL